MPNNRRRIGAAEKKRLAEIGKATQFKPGEVHNPDGRPKLPEEIKQMKEETLERAIILFHDKIYDEKWAKKAKDMPFLAYLEAAFDRLGLPKQTKNEHSGTFTHEHVLAEMWNQLNANKPSE